MKRLSTEAREHKEGLRRALAELKIGDVHSQLLELTKDRQSTPTTSSIHLGLD